MELNLIPNTGTNRDGFGIASNYSDKEYELLLPEGTQILVGDQKIKTAGVLVWKIK